MQTRITAISDVCLSIRLLHCRSIKTGVGSAILRHRWVVSRLIAALAIFAVVVAGLGITIAVLTSSKDQPPAASKTSLVPPPPRTPQVPTPVEFQLNVVVTEQNCAVPAGC